MYAKSVQEAWYIVCSEHTVLLSTVQFKVEVWKDLWQIIREGYDTSIPTRPQKINKERQKFKSVLKEYVE